MSVTPPRPGGIPVVVGRGEDIVSTEDLPPIEDFQLELEELD